MKLSESLGGNQMSRTLNLNMVSDLELLRQAMIDWLREQLRPSNPLHDEIYEWSTPYLAKQINWWYEGGLRAFVEADPELSLAC